MGRFALEETFSTILIPGNSLLHLLTVQDQVQCLTCVGRHLGRRRTVGAPHRQPGRARLECDPWAAIRHSGSISHREGKAASRKLQATMLQPTPATLGGISRLPMPLTSAVIDYRRRVIFLEELLLLFEPPASNWKRALVSFPARHLSHPASPGSVSAQRNRSAATFSCTPPAGPVRKWNGARREAIKVEGSGLRSSRCRRSRSLPDESPLAMQNRSRRVGAPPGRRVVQAGRPIQDW